MVKLGIEGYPGASDKVQGPNSCWVLKVSRNKQPQQAQGEKAQRGLKQDLPRGENTERLSSSGQPWRCTPVGDRPFIAMSHPCGSPGLVLRCPWSRSPRHPLGVLAAGKKSDLSRDKARKGPWPATTFLQVSTPSCHTFSRIVLAAAVMQYAPLSCRGYFQDPGRVPQTAESSKP